MNNSIKNRKRMKQGMILSLSLLVVIGAGITIEAVLANKSQVSNNDRSTIEIKDHPDLKIVSSPAGLVKYSAAKFDLGKNKIYDILNSISGTINFEIINNDISNNQDSKTVSPNGIYKLSFDNANNGSDSFVKWTTSKDKINEWSHLQFNIDSYPDGYTGSPKTEFPIAYSEKDNALYLYSPLMVLNLNTNPAPLVFESKSSKIYVDNFTASLTIKTQSDKEI